MHNPKANTHRLYVKMEEEGRGLVANWGGTQIRDSRYCRLLEDKTKHEFVNAIKIRKVTRNCILNCRHPLRQPNKNQFGCTDLQ